MQANPIMANLPPINKYDPFLTVEHVLNAFNGVNQPATYPAIKIEPQHQQPQQQPLQQPQHQPFGLKTEPRDVKPLVGTFPIPSGVNGFTFRQPKNEQPAAQRYSPRLLSKKDLYGTRIGGALSNLLSVDTSISENSRLTEELRFLVSDLDENISHLEILSRVLTRAYLIFNQRAPLITLKATAGGRSFCPTKKRWEKEGYIRELRDFLKKYFKEIGRKSMGGMLTQKRVLSEIKTVLEAHNGMLPAPPSPCLPLPQIPQPVYPAHPLAGQNVNPIPPFFFNHNLNASSSQLPYFSSSVGQQVEQPCSSGMSSQASVFLPPTNLPIGPLFAQPTPVLPAPVPYVPIVGLGAPQAQNMATPSHNLPMSPEFEAALKTYQLLLSAQVPRGPVFPYGGPQHLHQ